MEDTQLIIPDNVNDKRLYFSVCSYLLPEISQIIKGLDLPYVKVLTFNASCGNCKPINLEKVLMALSDKDVDTYVIIISGSCKIEEINKTFNFQALKTIHLDNCFNIFLNADLVSHLIQKGNYIITNGWLRFYEKHINNWGFDENTARQFFKESVNKILMLDTGIPGDYSSDLSAFASYIGLPYEVLPIGLSYSENYICRLIAEWRTEHERITTNQKLAAVSRKYTDYYVIFKHLDTLIELLDEPVIVDLLFELIYILFSPGNIVYESYFDDRETINYVFRDKKPEPDSADNSFDIEVVYHKKRIGLFKIQQLQFPRYIEQYKEMGRIIGQICALSVANARKYTTVEKQKEQLVVFTEELKKANEAKDKFLSVLSHDLKSPFNLLLGYTDLLVNEIERGNTGEISEYALVIRETLQNTWNLLVNLLEWSRNRSGMLAFRPGEINLTGYFSEEIPFAFQLAQKKQITISISISPNINVTADKTLFDIIIRNILSNAIKFTHQKGRITISAQQTTSATIISITDTGIGISEKRQEQLFKLENSASTPGTDYENGTGLGLILCKDLMDRHKGKIWIDSKTDKGSTFYLSFPKTISTK